jgi:hypothetical protein
MVGFHVGGEVETWSPNLLADRRFIQGDAIRVT